LDFPLQDFPLPIPFFYLESAMLMPLRERTARTVG